MRLPLLVGLGLLSLTSCGDEGQVDEPSTADAKAASRDNDVAQAAPADASGGTGGSREVNQHSDERQRTHRSVDPGQGGNGHIRHQRDGHGRQDRHGEGGTRRPDTSSTIAIGDNVPDFEVTIAGKKWKFSELRKDLSLSKDGTIVFTFWCSFCHSCRDVEQAVDDLATRYKGRAAVIALDASAGETTDGVTKFATERGLKLPIALNEKGDTADIFGARVTTTTVVIDAKGILRYRGQFGDPKEPLAENALKAVLAGEEVRVKKTRQKG